MICIECDKETSIAHHLKYFIKSNGKASLGGNEIHGPLCQSCWFDTTDSIFGKPKKLQEEHN